MRFTNREEAGMLLAKRLRPFRDTDAVVLALPRGGVPVAAQVATRLDCPLDVLIVRKIGAPGQRELALGAVECRMPAGNDERETGVHGLVFLHRRRVDVGFDVIDGDQRQASYPRDRLGC